MLARRLLMFAVILLVITAISTALAPPSQDPSPSPTAPQAGLPAAGASRSVARTIDASRERPATVEVEVGDTLTLTVTADEAGSVELRDLAQVKPVAEATDAVFDVRPTRPGDYAVVLLDAEQRTVGTVRVTPREE